MGNESILCIDLSSQKIKTAILNEKCEIQATTEQRYFYKNDDSEGFAKSYDAKNIWSELSSAIKEVMKKSKIDPQNIIGITSCAQRLACVFLSKDNEEIYAGPNCDARGVDSQYLIDDEFEDEEEIFKITGHNILPMVPLARLLWFQEEEEDLYQQIGKMLSLDDWIVYKLTNNFCADPSSASDSLMFDITKLKWSDKIIDVLDINREILPEIIQVSDIAGELTSQVANNLGLIKGTPIIKTGADTQASLIGASCVNDGNIGIVMGTTAPLYMVLDSPQIDPDLNVWTTCHAIKNKWLYESNTGFTGQIYDWYKTSFLDGLSDDVNSLAAEYLKETEPGANSTLAFLGPEKMNFKEEVNIKPGVFVLPTPGSISEILSDRKNFMRAILENIGFGILENLMQILDLKSNDNRVYCCGGMANLISFNEILSNILNRDLFIPNIKESSFIGETINVLVGLQHYSEIKDAANDLIKVTKIEPTDDIVKKYKAIFQRWSRVKEHIDKL